MFLRPSRARTRLAVPMAFAASLVTGISYGMHAPIPTVFARHGAGATYLHLEEIGMVFFVPYMIFPVFVGPVHRARGGRRLHRPRPDREAQAPGLGWRSSQCLK